MAAIQSVNVGGAAANPYKSGVSTGIGKRPVEGPVSVRDPGAKGSGLGSGLVSDFIGDGEHHGGSDQAVYAFAREDLDMWEERLGRALTNGYFGENLTTLDLDVNAALVGEQWRIGDSVVLQVTAPRIPCSTFRGWMGERGWLKSFTAAGRPGTYLRVVTPGTISAGDPVRTVHRPTHGVTVSQLFRALTTEPELCDEVLRAGDDLPDDVRELAARRETSSLG